MYPVFRRCLPTKVDIGNCFKSNAFNHSAYSVPNVAPRVSAHKLEASNVENKTKEREAGREGEAIDPSAVSFHARKIKKETNVYGPRDQGKQGCSNAAQMDGTIESIYTGDTFHLDDKIKKSLSWIRITEYTPYGEELKKANKLKSMEKEFLTVSTYNLLAQELLEKHQYLYSRHDADSVDWRYRSRILTDELKLLNADIFCFQEVDARLLDTYYNNYFHPRGYQGVYKRRTHGNVDGCAIYYRKSKLMLVDTLPIELYRESVKLLNRDNIGLALKLSFKDRPELQFVVATTHLLYNPKRMEVRLAQTQLMLAEIEKIAYKSRDPQTGVPQYLPIIFAGDMNYTPDSAVYQLVTRSFLQYEGIVNQYLFPATEGYMLSKTLLPPGLGVTDSCQYFSTLSRRGGASNIKFGSGALSHHLTLSSVYNHVKKDLPEATSGLQEWMTVDYIFYSQTCDPISKIRSDGRLKLVSRLALPNSAEADKELGSIPNLACGSDHLPLLATFHVTGPGQV